MVQSVGCTSCLLSDFIAVTAWGGGLAADGSGVASVGRSGMRAKTTPKTAAKAETIIARNPGIIPRLLNAHTVSISNAARMMAEMMKRRFKRFLFPCVCFCASMLLSLHRSLLLCLHGIIAC